YAGMHVAQATLSRDLDELGVVRLRAADGSLVYALPGEPGGPGSRPGTGLDYPERTQPSGWPSDTPGEAASPATAASPPAAGGDRGGGTPGRRPRSLKELMTAMGASATLVVLPPPAGAAQFLASIIAPPAWPAILGTVAGDDTVLVIARDP